MKNIMRNSMEKETFYDWCIKNNRQDLLLEWHKTRNGSLTPYNISAGSNRKIWWQKHYIDTDTNKEFTFEWVATPNNRRRRKCPYLCSPPKSIYVGFNDLQTKDPETAKYWHPTKNGALMPTDVFQQSGKKVWWYFPYDDPITKKHFDFEWKSSIQSMTERAEKCPYLANDKIWKGFNDLATRFPKLVEEWSSENTISPDEILPGSPKKVKWVCRKHPEHKWEANINSRTRLNSGCPYCANQKVMKGFNDLATTNPILATEWSNENKIRPTEVTHGSTLKIKWVCPQNPHHKYVAAINDRTSGKDCPYCAGRRVLKGDNDLLTLYPEAAAEWDYEKNGKLKPTEITAHNMRKVWWKCPNGHSYDMEVANKIKGGINCPICSNRRLLKGYNDLATLYPDIAKEWSDENDIPANEIIAGSGKRGVWICNQDPSHKWEATVSNRTYLKTGCPFCNTSHGEQLISSFLSNKNIDFKTEYRFEKCRSKKALPFDFAVRKENEIYLIEYDGEQHFNEKDYFGGAEAFNLLREHDNAKNNFCADNKILLLRIPYIYDPINDKLKIESFINEFLNSGTIAIEILRFYKEQINNNYYDSMTILYDWRDT